jgi:hypothetical protein
MRCIEFLHLFFSEFQILESEFQFLNFSTAEFEKKNPTGIFGIKNGIRILLPMGVPEIGSENQNSQPSHKEEDKIYSLTTKEIAEAQGKNQEIGLFKKSTNMPQKDTFFQLIEDATVLCKNGELIIPASLRHRAVGITINSNTLGTGIWKRQ